MLRIAPGMKFQASRDLVRTPLKHFPKPFKANQHSSFYFTLTSSPKFSIPKAMKHSSQDSEEPLPYQKASSKGFLQEIASLFHVSHDEGKLAPGKPQRSRSGRNVLMRLDSEHECIEEEENQFMESIDRVELEELERLISRMQGSTRIDEAIQKIGKRATMLKDQASQLELLIVELLIYKGDYDKVYKMVQSVLANAPEGDRTRHLLLRLISRMRGSTRIEEAIQKIGKRADMLKDQASQLELLIVELLIYKGDYDEAYKKVLPVVANAPEGDHIPHVLLRVIYQKEQEVKEPQQGEASKGH